MTDRLALPRGMPPDPGTVVTVADGVRARRIERRSPLPPTLDALLARLAHQRSRPVPVLTPRQACVEGEHERHPWVTGVLGVLELELGMCPYCGGVEVRDVSLDIHPGIAPGQQGPRRRSDVLGWYSGKRPGGRTYL